MRIPADSPKIKHQPESTMKIQVRTVFTVRCNAERRMEHVAHILERRTDDRRHHDRVVKRGIAATMAELLGKLRDRGLPTSDDGWK
jgi:hypothetical protein